jgi:hypothetical protein
LLQDATDKKYVGLLTDGSATTGISQFFSSTGPPPIHSEPFKQNKSFLPASSMNNLSGSTISIATVVRDSPLSPQTQPSVGSASVRTQIFNTTVKKGEYGIGLDLGKSKDGAGVVLKLKELPGGALNPALQCQPPIHARDVIIAVNGEDTPLFADAVRLIRSGGTDITLTIQRT